MGDNNLQDLVKSNSSNVILSNKGIDELSFEIEERRRSFYRIPSEIIIGRELAREYFDYYEQGVPFTIQYKGRNITVTVNERFKAGQLFFR